VAYTYKYGDRPLDGITIQRAVGRGGFGEVYYAVADSGKQIAVKYLRENPEVELRGIAQVMNLKSPNLITIYDVRNGPEGEPFVIMEYVGGPSLRELMLAEPNGLGSQKAAFFLKGMADGLGYLHERGIVHRDLKPANIFYDDGYVKIGDYGLSKHISMSAHSGNTVSVGTVHYMAPEIGSGSYSKAIDIYALGVMLYEMLTGRLPFTGSSMGEILMRHLKDNPDVSGVPEPYRSVILKALAKDPNDRYQDVNEMVDVITSSADVIESIESFDPATLSQVPRNPSADDNPTRTAVPAAAPPTLDVRTGLQGGDLPPIPPIPAMPGAEPRPKWRRKAEKAREKVRRKAERTRTKLHRKAQRIGAKLRKRFGEDVVVEAKIHEGLNRRVKPFVKARWPQLAVIAMAVVAISTLLTVFYHRGEDVGVAVGMMLTGGTVGVLLAHFVLVRRILTKSAFMERLAYATTAGLCMAPGITIASDEVNQNVARVAIAMIVTILLFNWKERVEDGRRQSIDGGSAFWHGFIGLIAGAMADSVPWMAAILCAALSMTVQAAAACWPVGVARSASPGQGGAERKRRDGSIEGEVEHAVHQVGAAVEQVGQHIDQAISKRREARDARSEPPAAEKPVQQQSMNLGYQPSFVGRTANAGVSLLGKMMLLIGLTAAFAYNLDVGKQQKLIVDGRSFVYQEGSATLGKSQFQVPKAPILAPVFLGMVFIAFARRHDGGAHWLRGFLGCCCGMAAAVLALSNAGDDVAAFLRSDWSGLVWDGPIIAVGALLTTVCALLWWPKKLPRGGPIII